jgi:hypothetical protein
MVPVSTIQSTLAVILEKFHTPTSIPDLLALFGSLEFGNQKRAVCVVANAT